LQVIKDFTRSIFQPTEDGDSVGEHFTTDEKTIAWS